MYSRSISGRNGYRGAGVPPHYGGTSVFRPANGEGIETRTRIHSLEKYDSSDTDKNTETCTGSFKRAVHRFQDDTQGSTAPIFGSGTREPREPKDETMLPGATEPENQSTAPIFGSGTAARRPIGPDIGKSFFEHNDTDEKEENGNDKDTETPTGSFKGSAHRFQDDTQGQRNDDILLAALIAMLFGNRCDDELLLMLVLLYILGM